MSRYHSYINSAKEILNQYNGEEPFSSFLKKFFSLNKKYGSSDRKQVSHLCYCYFRLGKLKSGMSLEERILLGLFLCSDKGNDLLHELKPEWNDLASLAINEKLQLIQSENDFESVYPIAEPLSPEIEKKAFFLSHLIQPDVFIRLRPGKEEIVKKKLQNAAMDFYVISDTCCGLPNSSKIDQVIEMNKEAVVQDYSSQRVGELLSIVQPGKSDRVWDCCAASGGKSIMLLDLFPDLELIVSDVRESMLINLKKRFREAGIKNYKSFVADLSTRYLPVERKGFNLIIADVPCSGSGTWGRTPENLSYFEMKKLEEYTSLQKKIVSNAIPHLTPGGYFLYVTCSVFKKENEDVVSFMTQNFPLQLKRMEVLKGFDKKADTMFAALMQKPL